MNYGNIINFDTGNCHGISVTLFVSGCTHNCDGCHNKESQCFDYGNPFTDDTLRFIKKAACHEYIDYLVISGGDPLHPNNVSDTLKIVDTIIPIKPIIIYTGYTIDEIACRTVDEPDLKSILYHDNLIIIDGKYNKNLKPEQLDLRGSTNQDAYSITYDTERHTHVIKRITDTYFKKG